MPVTLIEQATAKITKRKKTQYWEKCTHRYRLFTSAFNTPHIEILCIYTKTSTQNRNSAHIRRSFNGTNLPRQRRQTPRDTHHHYGAQQVGRLEVDPMSEKIIPLFDRVACQRDI